MLDYHHRTIHDASMRVGALGVAQLFPAIWETWTRKNNRPHKSTVTDHEIRKHSPRVAALLLCSDTMGLTIEAKDKANTVLAW